MKIKSKLRKGSKRALSLVLSLIMLMSAFCLMDIGSFIADAIVTHEADQMEKASSTGSYYAKFTAFEVPEMVYIKAGEKYSEYFLNPNVSEEVKSTKGSLSFHFTNAVSFTITAKLLDMNFNATSANYITSISLSDGTSHSGTSSGITVLESQKNLISTTISNITFNNNEANTIKTTSAKYMIEWNVAYKTSDGRTWNTVAYTGVRFPYLGQAGMALDSYFDRRNKTYGDHSLIRCMSTYSFITGVDSVSGGNAKSNFLNSATGKTAYTGTDKIAPLSAFSGSLNNGSAYTMPGASWVYDESDQDSLIYKAVNGDGTYFTKTANSGVFLARQAESASNVWYVNGYDNSNVSSDKERPDYSGYNNSNGYGVGQITIDKSRFNDFSEIPNLKCGWASLGRDHTNNKIYVQNIRNCAYTEKDAGGYSYTEVYDSFYGDYIPQSRSYIHYGEGDTKYCNAIAEPNHTAATLHCQVDTNHVIEPSASSSFVKGLYPINGNVDNAAKVTTGSNAQIYLKNYDEYLPDDDDFKSRTGTITTSPSANNFSTFMRFEFDMYMPGSFYLREYGYHTCVSAVGLNFTTVDKSAARTELKKLMLNGVSAEGATSSIWQTYRGYIRGLAKYLGDSEATSHSVVVDYKENGIVDTAIKNSNSNMIAITVGAVYFSVPETIYLTPTSGSSSAFQYELDSTPTRNGNTVTYTVNQGYRDFGTESAVTDVANGSIYFYYPNATNVTITCDYGYNSIAFATDTSTGSSVSSNVIKNTSGNEIKARITSGNADYHNGDNWNIQWSLKYFDTSDNLFKTMKAYTKVYSPLRNTLLAITNSYSYSGSSYRYAHVASAIVGINKVTANHYAKTIHLGSADYGCYDGDSVDCQGTYIAPIYYSKTDLVTAGKLAVPYWCVQHDTDSNDCKKNSPDGATKTNHPHNYITENSSTSSGASCWYSRTDAADINYIGGGGTVYIDTSRQTKIGHVPNFDIYTDIIGVNSTGDLKEASIYYGAYYMGTAANVKSDDNDFGTENIYLGVNNSGGSRYTVQVGNGFRGSPYGCTNSSVTGPSSTCKSTFENQPITNGTGLVNFSRSSIKRSSTNWWCSAFTFVNFEGVNKSSLRTELNNCIADNAVIQEYFYTKNSSVYRKYTALMQAAHEVLGTVGAINITLEDGTNYTKIESLKSDLATYHDKLLDKSDSLAETRATGCEAKQYSVFLRVDPNNAGKFIITRAVLNSDGSDNTAYVNQKTYNAYDSIRFAPGDANGNPYANYTKCIGLQVLDKPLSSQYNPFKKDTTNYDSLEWQVKEDESSTEERFDGAEFSYDAKVLEYKHAKRAALNKANQDETYCKGYYVVYFYLADQYVTKFDINNPVAFDGKTIPVNEFSVNKYVYTLNSQNRFVSDGFCTSQTRGESGGLTTSYDKTTGIITINGSAVDDIFICDMPMPEVFERGYYLRITNVGGTVSNYHSSSCFVLEYMYYNNGGIDPDNRIYRDITIGNLGKTFTFPSDNSAAPTDLHRRINFRFWRNNEEATGATVFNNYQIRVELTKTEPSAYAYSPNAIVRGYEETITPKPTAERYGYDFVDWYKEPTLQNLAFTNNSYTVKNNATLYAKFKAHAHDVLFDNLFDFDNAIITNSSGNPTGTNISSSTIYKDREHKVSDGDYVSFNAVRFTPSAFPATLTPTAPIQVKKDHTYRIKCYRYGNSNDSLQLKTYSGISADGKSGTGAIADVSLTSLTTTSTRTYEWKATQDCYVSLVFGITSGNGVIEYSDISFQDISEPNKPENKYTSEPFFEGANIQYVHTAEFLCGNTLGQSYASVGRKLVDFKGTLPTMTREGWQFNGWLDENDQPVDANMLMRTDGTVSLHSDWSRSSYNVYVDLDGGIREGDGHASITNINYYTEGEESGSSEMNTTAFSGKYNGQLKVVFDTVITIDKVSPPTNDYIFAGWSLSVDSTAKEGSERTAKWSDDSTTWDKCFGGDRVYNRSEDDVRFALTGDLNTIYVKDLSPLVGQNVTLIANWEYIGDANEAIGAFDEIAGITYGYNLQTNKELTKTLSEHFGSKYSDYDDAKNQFKNARDSWKNDSSYRTGENLDALIYSESNKKANLINKYGDMNVNLASTYLDNFTVMRADGSEITKNGTVKKINLNYYSYDTLNNVKTYYDAANDMINQEKTFLADVSFKGTTYKAQNLMNKCIAELAKDYAECEAINPKTDTTAPEYVMYDKTDDAADVESSVKVTPNYVYPEYVGEGTYLCYTNSLNPTVVLTVDESAGSGRVSYPTKATIKSNGSKFTKAVKETDATTNSAYSSYLNSSIGANYGGKTEGEYYKKKAVIVLTPDFEGSPDRTEAIYTITASDDANTATTNNKALQAKKYNSSSDDMSKSLKDGEISIHIYYHNAQYTQSFVGASLHAYTQSAYGGYDSWCNQFRVYRTSGGANNWEYPKEKDTIYKMYDKTFDEYTNWGSFIYVFTSTFIESEFNKNESTKSLARTYEWGSDNSDPRAQMVQGWFKSRVTQAPPTEDKNDDFDNTLVWNKIGDTGYCSWSGSNWNLFFYPNPGAYVYTHLIDRWGNVHNAIFKIGEKMDPKSAIVHSIENGLVNLVEDGGSGFDAVTVNGLSSFDIITDENSTYRDNVYTTTGDTIKLSTGQPNKEFRLNATDIATNSTDATVKTDSDGILELKVNDLAYAFDRDAYTFTLNGKQMNLFSGVTKHILSAEGSEVPEGTPGTVTVRTSADVGKVQLVNQKGETMTVTQWDSQIGNVKTWVLSRTLNPGEHEFTVKAKIGKEWIDEYLTATITVTTIINDTGKILDVTYPLSRSIENVFTVKVEGRARKVQFVDENNKTWTFSRDHEMVESIVSYDADGNEVGSTARVLAYEVWIIDADLRKGKYTAVGKFGNGWLTDDESVFPFEVVYAQ